MINTPTVLILGAGASAPKGFPTGAELLSQARRAGLQDIVEMIKPVGAPSAPALQRAVMGTGDKSLDAMLERRPDLVEAGKALMARALLYCEQKSLSITTEAASEWYRELWAALDADRLETFRRNQITIVTYNYDRSLEYFLITALCEKFRKQRAECGAALDCISPIHLHGQLGPLMELSPDSPAHVSYGCAPDDITNSDVNLAAQGIKIIHEAQPHDEGFVRTRDALSSAKKVVFLGFGYAKTNVERLSLKDYLPKDVPIYACTKGFTAEQVDFSIKPLFLAWHKRNFGDESYDIVEYLRHFPDALA